MVVQNLKSLFILEQRMFPSSSSSSSSSHQLWSVRAVIAVVEDV